MATSTPDAPMVVGHDCITGPFERPMNADELKQRDLDIASAAQKQIDDAAAEADHQAKLALVNAKLALVNLTPDDLLTLGKEFKTL